MAATSRSGTGYPTPARSLATSSSGEDRADAGRGGKSRRCDDKRVSLDPLDPMTALKALLAVGSEDEPSEPTRSLSGQTPSGPRARRGG